MRTIEPWTQLACERCGDMRMCIAPIELADGDRFLCEECNGCGTSRPHLEALLGPELDEMERVAADKRMPVEMSRSHMIHAAAHILDTRVLDDGELFEAAMWLLMAVTAGRKDG